MRKLSAILALLSMLFAVPLVGADDHVVSRGAADRRLNDAVAERARNIASLDALLATPGAEEAAALAGLDLGLAGRALPRLGDAELADLAQRAAALTADPVAGHRYHDATGTLMLVMVFAVMAVVLIAVADRR
jgi:hypothetical protein